MKAALIYFCVVSGEWGVCLQTKMRAVAKIDSRLSWIYILKGSQIKFCIVSGGGVLQTKMRSVAKIDSSLSGSHILKGALIHFSIVSGVCVAKQK